MSLVPTKLQSIMKAIEDRVGPHVKTLVSRFTASELGLPDSTLSSAILQKLETEGFYQRIINEFQNNPMNADAQLYLHHLLIKSFNLPNQPPDFTMKTLVETTLLILKNRDSFKDAFMKTLSALQQTTTSSGQQQQQSLASSSSSSSLQQTTSSPQQQQQQQSFPSLQQTTQQISYSNPSTPSGSSLPPNSDKILTVLMDQKNLISQLIEAMKKLVQFQNEKFDNLERTVTASYIEIIELLKESNIHSRRKTRSSQTIKKSKIQPDIDLFSPFAEQTEQAEQLLFSQQQQEQQKSSHPPTLPTPTRTRSPPTKTKQQEGAQNKQEHKRQDVQQEQGQVHQGSKHIHKPPPQDDEEQDLHYEKQDGQNSDEEEDTQEFIETDPYHEMLYQKHFVHQGHLDDENNEDDEHYEHYEHKQHGGHYDTLDDNLDGKLQQQQQQQNQERHEQQQQERYEQRQVHQQKKLESHSNKRRLDFSHEQDNQEYERDQEIETEYDQKHYQLHQKEKPKQLHMSDYKDISNSLVHQKQKDLSDHHLSSPPPPPPTTPLSPKTTTTTTSMPSFQKLNHKKQPSITNNKRPMTPDRDHDQDRRGSPSPPPPPPVMTTKSNRTKPTKPTSVLQ